MKNFRMCLATRQSAPQEKVGDTVTVTAQMVKSEYTIQNIT